MSRNKRMFSADVVETDVFLDMPASSQLLYFHLSMCGDDDGFVASPRKICRSCGCNNDDLKILITKGYVIPFDSGIVVIRHWNLNNYIRPDRYRGTIYSVEKSMLTENAAGYSLGIPDGIPVGIPSGIPKIEESKKEEKRNVIAAVPQKKQKAFIPPTLEEITYYFREKGYSLDPQVFFDYYAAADWHDKDGKPVRSWKQRAVTWNTRQAESQKSEKAVTQTEPVWLEAVRKKKDHGTE